MLLAAPMQNNNKHVTCHLSLTAAVTATDPASANFPTFHSRLVFQDRKVCLEEPSYSLKYQTTLQQQQKQQEFKSPLHMLR